MELDVAKVVSHMFASLRLDSIELFDVVAGPGEITKFGSDDEKSTLLLVKSLDLSHNELTSIVIKRDGLCLYF